jgi:hypothetical protein
MSVTEDQIEDDSCERHHHERCEGCERCIECGRCTCHEDEPEVGVDVCAHGVSYSDDCEECEDE